MHPIPAKRCRFPQLVLAALLLAAGCATTPETAQEAAPPETHSKTLQIPPFVLGEAPVLPSLTEAGFDPVPAFHETFDPGWEARQTTWEVGDWLQNGSRMDPSRCRTNGEGQLVQTVLPGKPYRGGTIQSVREFGYGRWLARLRPTAVPGILNSMFTKDWEDHSTEVRHDGLKGEVDFEFLTHTFSPGRGQVHLAIHLLEHTPLWQADVELDFNPSEAYHVWGFDILPDRVVWHVEGRVIHTWMYTEEHTIHTGYEMMFNSWTREAWIHGPPAEAGDYHIDWVRFHPYTGS